MLSIFIDTTSPGRCTEYAAEANRFIEWVRAAAPVDAEVPVILPGDRSRRVRAERTRTGIPIDDVTYRRIRDVAVALGLSAPELAAAFPADVS